MVSNAPPEKRNLIYLYDLPKAEFTSARLAEILKAAGIELELKPQVRRDPTKPFYSCICCIKDDAQFKKAAEVLRYFEIEGKQCRGLPFDNTLLGTNLTKTNEQCSVFVRKIPKDLNAPSLDERFSNFDSNQKRPVKSLKISMDEDHSSRGYGFITYDNPEDAQHAVQMLQESDLNQDCVAVPYRPKDRTDVRRIANNLYVKNYPDEWTDEELKKMFAPYGNISSIVQKPHQNGKFAFVCFMAEDLNDHEYGPRIAFHAMEELNGTDMGDGKKLYVAPALSQSKRSEQKLRETIKYKNSKKRCNLYVKNFDPRSTEENIRDIFKDFGEIESVKLFPLDKQEKAYAFVCFKTPDQAQQALQSLHNRLISNRQLSICHYELKEYRDIVDEETKDKLGFQRFKQLNYNTSQWNDIASRDEFYFKITQLLQTLPMQQKFSQNPGARQFGGGGGYRQNNGQQQFNNNRRSNTPHQNRTPHMQHNGHGMSVHQPNRNTSLDPNQGNMGYQPQPQQQQQMRPQPQPQSQMQQNQSYPPQQQMMQNQQQQVPQEEQRFYAATSKLVPSVKAENPLMKTQVGNAIFDFVQILKGRDIAPKITGMLIDLNLEEIQAYLVNYREFQKKVGEAAALLDQMQRAAQQQTPGGPPMMGGMQMPMPGQQMMPSPNMPQPPK